MQMCALNPVYVASAWFPAIYSMQCKLVQLKCIPNKKKGNLVVLVR